MERCGRSRKVESVFYPLLTCSCTCSHRITLDFCIYNMQILPLRPHLFQLAEEPHSCVKLAGTCLAVVETRSPWRFHTSQFKVSRTAAWFPSSYLNFIHCHLIWWKLWRQATVTFTTASLIYLVQTTVKIWLSWVILGYFVWFNRLKLNKPIGLQLVQLREEQDFSCPTLFQHTWPTHMCL